MSRVWQWRAQEQELHRAAQQTARPLRAPAAAGSSTRRTLSNRYTDTLIVLNILNTQTVCVSALSPVSLQEKSLPGVVMALVCNVFEMLYQLANLEEPRWKSFYLFFLIMDVYSLFCSYFSSIITIVWTCFQNNFTREEVVASHPDWPGSAGCPR